MKTILHVSSLSKYNTCPYQYRWDDSEVTVNSTYKGDILNMWVQNPEADLWAYLQWYQKNIDWDFKNNEMIKKSIEWVREYIKDVRKKFKKKVWQECKMFLQSNWYTIIWTPDLVYADKEMKYHVVDFKMSTRSMYGNDEMMANDCQRWIYPLMVMEYHWIPECTFHFMVFDKGKWEAKILQESVLTRKECQARLTDLLTRYKEDETFDEYKWNKTWKCYMCSLKNNCPYFR